ncbi:hypothetical protein EYV94_02440 [Puteibacter caeruleilacunae]|nr:hypothetical protein EYV94_02440 [Puteibacter caeruleilacunae]
MVLCVGGNLYSQGRYVPAEKEVFQYTFPINLAFRGEYKDRNYPSYQVWKKQLEGTDGLIKKFVPYDELDGINLKTQQWLKRYAEEEQTKLLLLHWDAREHRNDQPGSSDRYFPGHWLAYPGAKLVKSLNKHATEVYVSSIDEFAGKYAYVDEEYPGQMKHKPGSFIYPILRLVEVDEHGKCNWDKCEFVKLISINKEKRSLTIERNRCLTKASAFSNGAYIAPMSTRLGKEGLFDYNCSTACPKDANGKTALDIMHDELVDILLNHKKLNVLDGIGFDVLQWLPRSTTVDSNNDGIPDGGMLNGRNSWRDGTYAFMKKLRASLGDNVIITGDGYGLNNQRGIGLFNGIESEGLVEHNDAFRGFAKTVNVFSYWLKHNPLPHQLNYIVYKLRNSDDQKNEKTLQSLYIGTATCLEAGLTMSPKIQLDELIGGEIKQHNWLGKPMGDLIIPAQKSKDLLKGAGKMLSQSFINSIETINCTLKLVDGEIEIEGTNTGKDSELIISQLPKTNVQHDLTVFFDVMAIDSLSGFEKQIPRVVSLHADGLPRYEKRKDNNRRYNEQFGFFGPEWHQQMFYYRKASHKDLKLHLRFEEGGKLRLRNMTVHAAPSILIKEFEHGCVIVNPSFDEISVNIKEFLPNAKLEHIKGIFNKQKHTGLPVAEKVTVSSLSALFLVKSGQ